MAVSFNAVIDALRVPVAPDQGDRRAIWWGRHWAEVGWQLQLYRLLASPLYREGRGVPRGDGRPVVLIPGFLVPDSTLGVLSGWLRRIGYDPHGSGLSGVNVECFDRALDRVEAHVERLHAESGRRVTLVGHSRGGHFAKALAHRRPELVSQAISMGAGLDQALPVSAPVMAAAIGIRGIHRRREGAAMTAGCMTGDCGCRAFRDFEAAFPEEVPLTSIYTRGDGCVRWQFCLVDYARNVEVPGGHVGLAFERAVYAEIAETLATPERA
jgi:triacylglycerol lipase